MTILFEQGYGDPGAQSFITGHFWVAALLFHGRMQYVVIQQLTGKTDPGDVAAVNGELIGERFVTRHYEAFELGHELVCDRETLERDFQEDPTPATAAAHEALSRYPDS